jgi:predicted anti-sigma-YlaC factor YlaD
MDCEKAVLLLMGHLDGELDDARRRELEAHLLACPACRREERAYRRLTAMTDGMGFIEPTETEWRTHWEAIYNRMERGAAWILLSLGAIVLLLYGAWHLVADFLLDATYPLIFRLGVGLITTGTVVLAVSVVRERIRLYPVDRYEEVEL